MTTFSNPSDSCRYEMFRPPVCSCSIPGVCETTEGNVLEVWNLTINIMLCAGDHMSEWQSIKMAIQTYQSRGDLLSVSWCDLEEAKILFQILSSIKKKNECRLACEDFNLCTNYTFLGPENPLRWANTKSSHRKVCLLLTERCSVLFL